jgi:hypothetical protein
LYPSSRPQRRRIILFCCSNQLKAICSPQRGEKSDAPFPIALNGLHMLARVMHLHHLRSSAYLSQSMLYLRKGRRNFHEHVLTTHKRVRRIHFRAEFVPTFVASHTFVLETTHMAKTLICSNNAKLQSQKPEASYDVMTRRNSQRLLASNTISEATSVDGYQDQHGCKPSLVTTCVPGMQLPITSMHTCLLAARNPGHNAFDT